MRVIVHGGAGSHPARRRTDSAGSPDGKPEDPESRRAVLDEAARRGAGTDTVVDAVVEAVGVLESSPQFNAGVGSAVQSDGVPRTDAGLMTGERRIGAACSMPGVERAAEVARAVMEETPHVLLAGERAVDLADAFGVETGVDLWAERTRERWAAVAPPETGVREQLAWVREHFGGTDTVGAVAADRERVAAATSTGGRWFALAGRVGDSPQAGSGFYAAPAGGASATGAGEDIARATLCRRAVRHLEAGRDPAAAADLAVEEFAELTGSTAGVIVMDAAGNPGNAYNSDAMETSVAEG